MRSCGRVRRSCKDTPQSSPVEVIGVPLGILPSIPPNFSPLLLPDAALLTAAHIQYVSCPMWPWDHTGCEIVPSGNTVHLTTFLRYPVLERNKRTTDGTHRCTTPFGLQDYRLRQPRGDHQDLPVGQDRDDISGDG